MRDREKNRGTMLVSTAVILCVATFAIGFAGGTLVANHSAPAPASAPQTVASAPAQGTDIQALREAAQSNPSQASGWIRLGNACYDAGKPDEAIDAYQKALVLEPDNADVITDMGSMYRMKKLPDKAVECYDRAVTVHPGHRNAIFNKGVTIMIDMEAPARAWAFWRGILNMDPGFTLSNGTKLAEALPSIAIDAGHHLENVGRPEAALQAYAVAMEADPSHVQAVVHRAALLERLGRADEALPLWHRALELDPQAVDTQGAPVRNHIDPS